MLMKQISVFVENKAGRLAEITKKLGNSGVNIRALSIADTTDFGILRLIVDDPEKAQAAMAQAGFTVSVTQVFAIGLDDVPGGLGNVLQILLDEGINVEYMYAFVGRLDSKAYVIARVEDNQKAIQVLKNHQIPVLTDSDHCRF